MERLLTRRGSSITEEPVGFLSVRFLGIRQMLEGILVLYVHVVLVVLYDSHGSDDEERQERGSGHLVKVFGVGFHELAE